MDVEELGECDLGRSRACEDSTLKANGEEPLDEPGTGGTGGASSVEREKNAEECADVAGVAGVAGVVGVKGSLRYDAPDPDPFDPENDVTPLCVSQYPPGEGMVAECGGVEGTVRLRSTVGWSGSGGAGLLCMSASQR